MNSAEQTAEVFELMQRLIEYRYDKPLHHQIMKAADYSMLSEDVLVLIYHMAKVCDGGILEIGSFLGASTVAAGMGARASGREKKFVSIEPGGALIEPARPIAKNLHDVRQRRRHTALQSLDGFFALERVPHREADADLPVERLRRQGVDRRVIRERGSGEHKE